MGAADAIVYFVASVVLVSGALLVLLAGRIPANPIFGFRIGYAYVSKRAWVKLNRVAGACLCILGASLIPQYLLLGDAGTTVLLFGVELTALTAALILYGERVAEAELISEAVPSTPGKPVPVRGYGINPLAAALVILGVLILAYSATLLPSIKGGEVAVHFGASGEPNGFMPASQLPTLYLAPAFVGGLTALFMFLSVRKPESFYKPWLTEREITVLTHSLQVILASVFLVISVAIYDTIHYNIYEAHAVPLQLLIPASLAMILAPTAILVAVSVKAYMRWVKGLKGW